MSDDNPIAYIQDDIADRLNADSYFEDITIIRARDGDIDTELDKALRFLTPKNSKIGAACIVGGVQIGVSNPDTPGPYFDDGFIAVDTFENPVFNDGATGTGKRAEHIAGRANQVLHHYIPGGLGGTMLSTKRAIFPLPERAVPQGASGFTSVFSVPIDNIVLDKVTACTITPSSGTAPVADITITCPTAGVDIYYTTDFSHPWPGNTNATLYAGPFTVASAALLRAIAYKTDMVASDAAFANYT